MAKIDTSNWGKFKIGDIFKVNSSKKSLKASEAQNEGPYPYVTRGMYNNGVKAHITQNKEYLNPENSISFAMDTYVMFYQKDKYFTGNNMKVLTSEHLNKNNAIFLTTCMSKAFQQLNYSSGMTIKKIRETIVHLPQTPEGTPDWDYMEAYMEQIRKRVDDTVTTLEKVESPNKPIDTSQWGDFKIGDIFETKGTKTIRTPTGANVPTTALKDGKTPRITVTAANNGVSGYYDSDHKNYRTYENFISVSFLGTVFYQKTKSSLDMKVHVLKPLNHTLNNRTGIFLSTIIKKAIGSISYADQISSELLPTLTIKLPQTTTGEPDWAYMEAYMDNVRKRIDQKVAALEGLK